MAKVSPISTESKKDWYEAIIKDQPDAVELSTTEQEMFHNAFECFTDGNNTLAYQGFSELAEKGSSISQYFLGVMCLKGLGVLQDFLQAHMWFNISASKGHKKARAHLDTLTDEMGADQIGEAQKMARDWVNKKTIEI
ncbi:MAG: hypothetical protein AAF353_11295 [Pseudomonadota bacterium]